MKLRDFLQNWINQSNNTSQSRELMIQGMQGVQEFMRENQIASLWKQPPTLYTATLDDALGHGLDIIESFSMLLGMTVNRIGLLCDAETIINTCQTDMPDYLGMTILQFDSELALQYISQSLPKKTFFLAGGPLFKNDLDFAQRCGINFVAKDIFEYIQFLIHHI
ncbi:MAG: hypothetical protein OMM_06344 [Candidatus Magnetoglobus multicellularis str. Araruama]|uniref:B12-binding domain-containing protein n=1 Tax=Candidatus Magnetoglobus multicellularis str. Araruama TaxID=890399 RepID=A0A1V1PI04_9BACT|nr:MAG: hypothetical protein OMM_06344 [Candidatus Magnetoglobus multicellularis str. Araruama]